MPIARVLDALSVLVVEDDADTRELYRAALRAAGADVRCVATAESALAVLASWRPDAILCDLHLPGVDGIALLRDIQADPRLAGIRVISISGSHPTSEQVRSFEAGFALHLVKPVRIADIASALTSVMAMPR